MLMEKQTTTKPRFTLSPKAKEAIVAPVTQHTTNFGQFKYLPDNRPIFRGHVQDLISSYEENPGLIELKPILVNEHMEVVDGQHRLEACKTLNLPIPYQVVAGLTIGTAQLMNALQKPWRLIDFIHSYAGSGKPDYQYIERLMHDYEPIGPSVTLAYASKNISNKVSFKQQARLGKLDLLPKNEIGDRLNKLTDLDVPFWSYEAFAMAFLRVLRTVEGYDHERMKQGIKNAEITRQATTIDDLRELERAYNWKKSVDIVRFF